MAAERALSAIEATMEQATAELEAAEASGDDERLAAARRFDIRARDRLHMAERRAADTRRRSEELEARAAAVERESRELDERAQQLARALGERPRLAAEAGVLPAAGLDGIAEWGTRARAALLVARSQLSAERDGLIRQANELGELVLGEPLVGVTPDSVAKRLEQRRGQPPA